MPINSPFPKSWFHYLCILQPVLSVTQCMNWGADNDVTNSKWTAHLNTTNHDLSAFSKCNGPPKSIPVTSNTDALRTRFSGNGATGVSQFFCWWRLHRLHSLDFLRMMSIARRIQKSFTNLASQNLLIIMIHTKTSAVCWRGSKIGKRKLSESCLISYWLTDLLSTNRTRLELHLCDESRQKFLWFHAVYWRRRNTLELLIHESDLRQRCSFFLPSKCLHHSSFLSTGLFWTFQRIERWNWQRTK